MKDVLLVMNCVVCGDSHFYELKIKRILFASAVSPMKHNKEFSRIFICPNEKVDFKITTYLFPGDKSDYISVESLGVIKNDKLSTKNLTLNTEYFDKQGLTKHFIEMGIPKGSLLVPPGGLKFNNYNVVGVIG